MHSNEVKSSFERVAPPVDATIIRDAYGASMGIARVRFASSADANLAQSIMNIKILH